MIKNGRPYSNESGYVDASLITDHTQEEIDIVNNWIDSNIIPTKTPLMSHTSYSLKHILESDTGIYLTNNEFKDALLLRGYSPVNTNDLNWHYCISKRSPAFINLSKK